MIDYHLCLWRCIRTNELLTNVSCSLFSQPAATNIEYVPINKHTSDLCAAKMDIPRSQRLTLLDLPNEILLIIKKYLSMADVFSAFGGLTKRLDQLVLDPIGTRTLNMHCLRLDRLPDRIYSIDDRALETICRNVLPRICHHVTELIVDQFTIESVIRASEFPALCSLSLLDIDKTCAFDILQGKLSSSPTLGES
jgi:hypothetical protein